MKDLTIGKPEKVLWKFCLPLFGSIIFQQLYNLADSFVAGKFGGENALASIGNSYEITLILIAFAFGCNIGGSVICAKYFGAKKYDKVKTTIYTTLITSTVICILLMIFGLLFSKSLLKLIHTPEEILNDSFSYLRIYLYSLPFVFLYNVSEGIFSGLGDSKTPFIFLSISSICNIVMDIEFAFIFDNVVIGVAYATLICQAVSCILALICLLFKLKKIKTENIVMLFSFKILKEISIIAIPSILQQSFISFGNIVIQSIINSFGPSVIAGYSASVKLNNLVITSLTTLANGISNYTSQNIGANKLERVKTGYFAGLKLVWILCIPFVLTYCIFGKTLVSIFMNNPTDLALMSGKKFLLILSPFYFVVAAKLVTDGILRGSKMMGKFMIATFTDLTLRVILAFILSRFLDTTGIWISWPIGWCISTILSYIFYKTGVCDKKKIIL